jgi:hypothetical protein
MYCVSSASFSGGGDGPIPTRRARDQDWEMIESGAEILRASIMVLKKEGVTSMMMIRLGAEGSLGGSLMVTIIDSVGKFSGKTLRFWRVWRMGEGLKESVFEVELVVVRMSDAWST